MENTMFFLVALAGICILFGVVYPLFCLVLFFIYRINGGKQSLKEFMKKM